ncbi:hypothetical protein B6254_1509 [Weissella cibaria]|uniref:Uncharacterized protein n=1 Tax=Weissella cibaria TaxID=137591 RepID=A0A2S1KSJ0_9LACO|nr:hypothetical protein B6254_1509 [Weissella cibaria]
MYVAGYFRGGLSSEFFKESVLKINLYKADERYTKYSIRAALKKLDYITVGETRNLNNNSSMRITVFAQQLYSNKSDWREILDDVFSIADTDSLFKPKQLLRVILVASYYNDTYLISYGMGYLYAQQLADTDFASEFVLKISNPTDVMAKTVQYLHSARSTATTNYLSANADIPEANESYQAVKIRPRQSNVFGKNIYANIAVNFSPSMSGKNGYLKILGNLIWTVNFYNQFESKSVSYPRAQRIKDRKYKKRLNHKLLQKIIKYDSSVQLLFSFNDGLRTIEITEGLPVVGIINGKSKMNKHISFTRDSVINWIRSLSEVDFSRMKILVSMEEGEVYPISLLKMLSVEFYGDDQNVLLDRGQWAILNEKYIENIGKELSKRQAEILVNYNDDKILPINSNPKQIEVLEERLMNGFNTLMGNQYIKTHKKLLYSKHSAKTKIELGDLYNKEEHEIIAVKRVESSSTPDMVYSLEQSINSMAAIRHLDEYKPISIMNKEEILGLRTITVFWIFSLEMRQNDVQRIIEGSWKLSDINSIILTSKVIEWYKYAINNGFIPKIMVGYY